MTHTMFILQGSFSCTAAKDFKRQHINKTQCGAQSTSHIYKYLQQSTLKNKTNEW